MVFTRISAGYAGLVLMHAALNATGLARWTSHQLAIAHPTYYGMLVMSAEPS